MNLTMTMTLDGLIRALRVKEHDLAERIEAGYALRDGASDLADTDPLRVKPATAPAQGDDDDRRGR